MAPTAIRLDVTNGTAFITLDGPATRNALDAAAATELVTVCNSIDADHSIGAAVITGANGTFCSGADTHVLDGLRSSQPHEAYDGLDALYAAFQRLGKLTVPVLAVVDGPAVGAGVNLALAADLRLVTKDASFVSGFARIGLHPGGGHLHLLTRAAGSGIAAAAAVFAQPITADQAVASGLAAESVPVNDLPTTISRYTRHLAVDPALARALVQTLRRTVLDPTGWDRAVEIERARQMWSLTRPRTSSRTVHQPKES